MVRNGAAGYLLVCLLCIVIAALLTTCGGAGGTPSSFTLVSGSGTVTVNLLGAAGFVEDFFYFGTTSTGTPIGGGVIIDDSNNMALTLNNGTADVVFTGGTTLLVGGFIDIDGDGGVFNMADDGDWGAGKYVTVSGNETVTLTYPGDFAEVSNSGTVSINLNGAVTGGYSGTMFYFGAISNGTVFGGEAAINGDAMTLFLDNGEVPIVFTGEMQLEVGGFIDVDGDAAASGYAPDDGDLTAGGPVTVNGASSITLNYPAIMGVTIISAVAAIILNLVADLIISLDPRARK